MSTSQHQHRRSAVTLRGWLHDQRGRPDPVGDLARYALGGACTPSCAFSDFAALVRHLGSHEDAPDALFAAARRALKEHRSRGGRS